MIFDSVKLTLYDKGKPCLKESALCMIKVNFTKYKLTL